MSERAVPGNSGQARAGRAARQAAPVAAADRSDQAADPVLVSHATFILGTSLALLAGLLLGLMWGARLGYRTAHPRPGVTPAPVSAAGVQRPIPADLAPVGRPPLAIPPRATP